MLFEGLYIGIFLVFREYTQGGRLIATFLYTIQLCLTAAAPTLFVFFAYAVNGYGSEYIYANFLSIFGRHADSYPIRLDNAFTAVEILFPLALMATIGGFAIASERRTDRKIRFAWGWLATSIFGFIIFGGWYNHYTLPVMLPGAVCSAAFLAMPKIKRWFFIPAAFLLFLAGQKIIAADQGRRGTPAQFYAIIDAIGKETGTLYVDWGEPAFFTFTDRRPLSRFVFPTHLQIAREAGAIGVDQKSEIRRIFMHRPDVVVLMGPSSMTEEDPRTAQMVGNLVKRGGYRTPIIRPLGRLMVAIYRLKPTDRNG